MTTSRLTLTELVDPGQDAVIEHTLERDPPRFGTSKVQYDEAGPVAGNRLMLAVLDLQGREDTIEISIRRDTVECWSQNRCCGVFVRDQLRVWLAAPFGCYAVDELLLAQTRDGISLLIDGQIPWHPLASHVLDALRQRI